MKFYYDNEEIFINMNENDKNKAFQLLMQGGLIKEEPYRAYELDKLGPAYYFNSELIIELKVNEKFKSLEIMYNQIEDRYDDLGVTNTIEFCKNSLKKPKLFKDSHFKILLDHYLQKKAKTNDENKNTKKI